MEKRKELLGEKTARAIAAALREQYPAFPEKAFLRKALPELKGLELKGRVKCIAQALKGCLPGDPREAYPILLRSVRSDRNLRGLTGFQAWPFTQYVEDNGLDHLGPSLQCLKELTKVMSAEFAVRAFLLHHQKETLATLECWLKDESVDVRRLVSEGTRPRLPWGQRLPAFQKDPETCIGLLRALRLDPEPYVRKSVANHLNDISKDHPDWLVQELMRWQRDFPDHPSVRWILRHGSRSLVKAGHPGALRLLGFRPAKLKNAALTLSPATVTMGQSLQIRFQAEASRKERWLIDYAVHHRKANGALKAKVFKWTQKAVTAGEKVDLQKRHAFVPISTRKYYGGEQEVEVLVNGQSAARAGFQLRVQGKTK